jgi:PHAX RNA-binding domain
MPKYSLNAHAVKFCYVYSKIEGTVTMIEQYRIAERLGESAPQAVALIGRIIRAIGPDAAQQLVERAVATEQGEGMLTDDGSRRRTLGGIFFVLVKQQLREQGQDDLAGRLFPRRQQRRSPAPPPQPAVVAIPVGARARPRMRGRSELPPAATVGGRPAPAPEQDSAPSAIPSQASVIGALDRQIGAAPEFYRRSYNPASGALTLFAHFPPVAQARYATQIAAASAAAGVAIAVSPQPNQASLVAAAAAALPSGAQILRSSAATGRDALGVAVAPAPTPAEIEAACSTFSAATGWTLEITPVESAPAPRASASDPNAAIGIARRCLPIASGCYAIGAQSEGQALLVRFFFPDVARASYARELDQIRAESGWDVLIHPAIHQEMLIAAARHALPLDVELPGAPSLHFDRQIVTVRCRGDLSEAAQGEAQQRFAELTGWVLGVEKI